MAFLCLRSSFRSSLALQAATQSPSHWSLQPNKVFRAVAQLTPGCHISALGSKNITHSSAPHRCKRSWHRRIPAFEFFPAQSRSYSGCLALPLFNVYPFRWDDMKTLVLRPIPGRLRYASSRLMKSISTFLDALESSGSRPPHILQLFRVLIKLWHVGLLTRDAN